MNKLVGGLVLAAAMLAGPALAQEVCLTQEEVVDSIIAMTSDGTKVEIQSDLVLVFSNPNEVTYYKVDFVNGCALPPGEVIDQVAFDNLKTGI